MTRLNQLETSQPMAGISIWKKPNRNAFFKTIRHCSRFRKMPPDTERAKPSTAQTGCQYPQFERCHICRRVVERIQRGRKECNRHIKRKTAYFEPSSGNFRTAVRQAKKSGWKTATAMRFATGMNAACSTRSAPVRQTRELPLHDNPEKTGKRAANGKCMPRNGSVMPKIGGENPAASPTWYKSHAEHACR